MAVQVVLRALVRYGQSLTHMTIRKAGKKISHDLGRVLRFSLSKAVARTFYTSSLGWSTASAAVPPSPTFPTFRLHYGKLLVLRIPISWDAFLLGRVSLAITSHQEAAYLAGANSPLTASDWVVCLICQLLRVAHSQWIYCNTSLHDQSTGYRRIRERCTLLDWLSALPPESVPPLSWYLLDIDFSSIPSWDTDRLHYWVLAIRAAEVAGCRASPAGSRRSVPPWAWRRDSVSHPVSSPYYPIFPPPVGHDISSRSHRGLAAVFTRSSKWKKPD
eukprot:scaffold117520_cov80-Cyclotella_meneghiniana.AAC.1